MALNNPRINPNRPGVGYDPTKLKFGERPPTPIQTPTRPPTTRPAGIVSTPAGNDPGFGMKPNYSSGMDAGIGIKTNWNNGMDSGFALQQPTNQPFIFGKDKTVLHDGVFRPGESSTPTPQAQQTIFNGKDFPNGTIGVGGVVHSADQLPSVDFINSNNAYKNMWDAAKAKGASQAALDQIGSLAAANRAKFGVGNTDALFGGDAGTFDTSFLPQTQQQPQQQQQSDQSPFDIRSITDTISGSVMGDIQKQIDAHNQALAQQQQANQLGIDQNKAYLADQIKQFGERKAVDSNDAATLQNRRGGFYSGGLDYQLGSIGRGYAQAQEGLTRDVEARNADIWNRNALLAQQTSENINRLQQQAPDLIRQRVLDELNRVADHTGNLPGYGRTMAGQQQDFSMFDTNRKFDQGVAIDNRDFGYKAGQDAIANQAHADENATKLAMWATETFGTAVQPNANAGAFFQQLIGLPTMQAQKLAIDVQQMGFENGIKKALAENTINETQASIAINRGQLAVSQQNANTSSYNAVTSRNNSDSSVSQSDKQAKQREFEGTVMGEISKLTTPDELKGWLNVNKKEITTQLGADGYAQIEKIASGQFPADNSKNTTKSDAISMAQKDVRWPNANMEKKAALIKEYQGLLSQ